MAFKMWSIWHFLFILAPIIIFLALYFLLRNKSEKTKYIVGVVIGSLSLACILTRNIFILCRDGLDPQALPLQICHFGNIMVFVSLVFKSKIATSITWTLNLFSACTPIIFADALTGYSSVWEIKVQTYIWGHILIVVGSLYAVLLKIVRIDFKSFLYGFAVLGVFVVPSIILNPYFNNVVGSHVNYFYMYNTNGISPLKFLYNSNLTHSYGSWFQINYLYTLLILIGLAGIMVGFYFLQKLVYLKDKDYQTHNIFYKESKKAN